MVRATWKGFISFGLVNIPVSLYSGEKRGRLEFDLLDVRDNARIRYQRINEDTGEEVPWDQIVRAYEYQEGNYVLVGEEDFERSAVKSTKTIAVETFIDRGAIQPIYFEKPYIVTPSKGGEKAYLLLREALQSANKAGIAKVVIRGRQYLVALMAEGSALIACRLRFAQELTDPETLDLPRGSLREYGVSAQDLDMAERLIEAMSGEWRPETYRDDYREALLAWIEKKARTGEVVPEAQAEPEQAQEEPVDISALLQRSLEEARSR
jgi:DNA end-binding protein Ku